MLVDREVNDLYRALLMKDCVGESFDATITGVAEHGLYVTFEQPFVEARVPIDTLGDDWYELDSLGLRLVGARSGHSFALGDRLTVRLENVSVPERSLTAAIEEKLPDDRELLGPGPRRRREGRKPGRQSDERGKKGRGKDHRGASSKSGGKPAKAQRTRGKLSEQPKKSRRTKKR